MKIRMLALALCAMLLCSLCAAGLAAEEPKSKTLEESTSYDYGTLKIQLDQWHHEFKKHDLRFYIAHV